MCLDEGVRPMRLIRELRSHLQYKIILPFLLLTMVVALAGSAVAFLFISGTAQERLNNQLAQITRNINDKLGKQESDNLLFLRQVVFAQANPEANAPAVADALANGDTAGLARALDPYFRISSQRVSDRVRSIGALWFVPRILEGQSDELGDKYAGLLEFGDGTTRYLFTVAPVI